MLHLCSISPPFAEQHARLKEMASSKPHMQHFQILPLLLPVLLTVAYSTTTSPKTEEMISAGRDGDLDRSRDSDTHTEREREVRQRSFAEHGQFCACRLEVPGVNGRLLAKCLRG